MTMVTGALREYANAPNKEASARNTRLLSTYNVKLRMLQTSYTEREATSQIENSFVQSKFYFRTETFKKKAAPESESGA